MQAAATQDTSSRADASGTTAIMSTVFNAKCAHVIGIPHEALREGERIGAGSFGICRIYNIRGISFFPEHMQYVGKCYKGGEVTKFDSSQTEQGMQFLHPSIVRCIGFTTEAPWITFFPLYNGGSLGDLFCQLPFGRGAFRRVIHRLEHGFKAIPPPTQTPNQLQMARIKAVVRHMPAILHAIVDVVAAAHA